MRTDALINLTTSAEYWDFTTAQDPISGNAVNTYHLVEPIKLMITENNGVPIAFSRKVLKFNGQLRNITDRSGTSIFSDDDGRVAYLGTPIAQFDVFGNVIGYKYTLTRGAA